MSEPNTIPPSLMTWIAQKTGIPSETWFVLGKLIAEMLLATGAIKPADATTLYGALTNLSVGTAAVFAGAWTVISYIKNRSEVKKTAIMAGSGSLQPASASVSIQATEGK